MARRTHYWRIPLLPRDLREMVCQTPLYNPDHLRGVVEGWWKGIYLQGDGLHVSVHLHGLLTPKELVRRFEALDLSSNPKNARPAIAARPKWVLVEVVPEVMDASRKARSRLKTWGADVLELDTFRTAALRDIVLDVYGGDPVQGWD